MPQEAGCFVEEYEIEAVARDDASQPVEEQRERSASVAGSSGTDLDRQVNVALRARPASGVGAKEVGQLDPGQGGQGRGESGNEIGVTGGLHDVQNYHRAAGP